MGLREDGVSKVSHSMLATFRRCPYKFRLSYLDDYQTSSSLGLHRGSAGHAAMEYYYDDRENVTEQAMVEYAWEHYAGRVNADHDLQMDPSEFDLLEAALRRYYPWAQANDKFKVLETEKHFEIELGPYTLQGYIDGVVEEAGQVWILEHKFLKQVSTKHLPLDPQVSIYMLGALQLGLEPAGVMYNMVRMSSGPTAQREPVKRVRVYRNPEGLITFAQDLVAQADHINMMIDEDLTFFRNPTKDCTWDCPFNNVCLDITDSGSANATLSRIPKKARN